MKERKTLSSPASNAQPNPSKAPHDPIATQRAWVEVDYQAIAHNVDQIQKLIGNTKIMGIVKADAYGHGAIACAKALQACGVDFFAVACLQEAQELRQAGLDAPILILGYTPPANFAELARLDLIQSLLSKEYAQKLSAFGQEYDVKMKGHVKVDTGMNRTGILYQDGAKEYEDILALYRLPGLQVEGIFSHFPVSDDLGSESTTFTQHQIDLFNEVCSRLKKDGLDVGLRHIQNSYGILNYQDLGMDYCRPGLLYMGVTSDDAIPILTHPHFIPILALKAKVTLVKTIPNGASVSYGRHYTAQGERKIASLSIGYADGLSRACSNQNLMVSIRGHLVPLVGNICMDQCMADITGFDDIQEGDVVTIIGQDGKNVCSVDQISRLSHTINNETLSCLTKRVVRLAK